MPLKSTLLFLFLLHTAGLCMAQCADAGDVGKNGGYLFLNKYTDALQTTVPVSLDSVLSPGAQQMFLPLKNNKVLQRGYNPDSYWFRFVLCNRDTAAKELILLLGGLGIRKAAIWQSEGSKFKVIGTTGYQYPFSSRPYPFVHHALPLVLSPQSTATFYIQLEESHAFKSTAFVVAAPYKMKRIEHRFYFVFGLISGVLLLFFVLNVYLFFSIKERIHLWYALYIISILFFLVKNEGLDAEFLGLDSTAGYRGTYMAAVADVSIAALLQVVQMFLTNLSRKGRVFQTLQAMKWLLLGLAIIEWLVFNLQPASAIEALVFKVARSGNLVAFISIIMAGSYSFFKGFKPALFLLAGQGFFIIGAISRVLFLETESFIFPPSLFEIGLVVEVMVISYGLMYRYNQYKQEKEWLATRLETEQVQAARRMVAVQEAEQRRIAEDLHDEIGGNLAALKMTMQSFALPEQQAQTLAALIDGITTNARHIAHNLMPPEFDGTGLAELLSDYYERLNKEGTVRFRFYSSPHKDCFTKEDELVLYRVVMEATNNIIKHARATDATVQLIYHEDQLSLTAEDNGIGLQAGAANGLGFRNIRSRVSYLNGEMAIDSGAHGTTIIINLPYKK